MSRHLTKGFIIRGLIFISTVIIMAAFMMFGDIPNDVYWAFIISTNVVYHTSEYIIRLRRERDMYKTSRYQYKTACEALLEISAELGANAKEALRHAGTTDALSQFDNEEDLT